MRAELSATFAAARFSSADVGSIVARISPALTVSPTAVSTASRVPLVAKLTVVEFTAERFPEAVTLLSTVPRVTVVVLVTVVADDVVR